MAYLFLFIISLVSQTPNELLDRGYEKYLNENYTGAIEDFGMVIKMDSKNAEAYYLRGVCYSSTDQKKQAMEDLQEAVKINSDYSEAHYEIGYLYLTDQNPPEAISAFTKALASNPEFAEAYVSRGTAKCMMYDVEGAQKDWEKAKALGVSYTEYMTCE